MSLRMAARPLLATLLLVGWAATGCGDDTVTSVRGSGRGKPAGGAASTAGKKGAAAQTQTLALDALPALSADEGEDTLKFIQDESSNFRDPFRSFLQDLEQKGPEQQGLDDSPRSATEVYAVGEYTIIGIITGTPVPKAMVVDPTGFGHVIRPGDRIGKQGGRVVAIYANEVVIQAPPPAEEETVLYLNPPEQSLESYGLNVVESSIETEEKTKRSSARQALKGLDLRELLGALPAEQVPEEGKGGQAGVAAASSGDLPPIPVVPLLPSFMMQPGTGTTPLAGGAPGEAEKAP